jgi:hypothetical protein
LGVDPDWISPSRAVAIRKKEIFEMTCRRFGLQMATLRLLPAEDVCSLISAAGGPAVQSQTIQSDLAVFALENKRS